MPSTGAPDPGDAPVRDARGAAKREAEGARDQVVGSTKEGVGKALRNRRERSEHLGGVAVPILDPQGRIAATIGITVPVFRLDQRHETRIARLAMAAAGRVERTLHGEMGGGE